MTVSETLETAWKALRGETRSVPGVYERRVFGDSKYSLFVAISHPAGLSQLVFVVSQRSAQGRLDAETRGFKLHVEVSGDPSRARIRLEETHRAFRDLFEQLSQDVVAAVLASKTEELAVDSLCTRVAHWQRFMERAGDGLSIIRQIGLYGELYFLRKLIVAGCRSERAIEGWQGPLDANHDFMLGNVAVEVKSTASNIDTTISISNERQLDNTGVESLFLCHISFDRREHTTATLPALIEEIAGIIGSTLAPVFEDRLLAAGYHRLQAGLYRDIGYTERKVTYYRVSGLFPRIVPSDLKTGVQEVEYRVQVAAATSFVVLEPTIFSAIV